MSKENLLCISKNSRVLWGGGIPYEIKGLHLFNSLYVYCHICGVITKSC